jgi:pimeloyl-ACP methyl ester carboxylesterase
MNHPKLIVAALLLLSFNFTRAAPPSDILDKAPSHFAKSGDLKVHYKTLTAHQDESRPALVFIHGWCCDLSVWRDQAAAFNGKAKMIFIDLPGYGKSDHPRIDYTTELFVKGINAVLEDAKVPKAVLVGHSMGAPIVRHFYRLHPAKTHALVIVDGALRPFTRDPEQIERFVSRFTEENFKETGPQFLKAMFPNEVPGVSDHVEKIVLATDPHVAVSSMRGMMDLKHANDDPIKTPTQCLMAKSPFWTADYKDYLQKLIPDLDYREFEGVGHFLFMEKPQEFNATLSDFLKKQQVLQ